MRTERSWAVIDEDGDIKSRELIEFLRWMPQFGAYFVVHLKKTTAMIATTEQVCDAINKGEYKTSWREGGGVREGDGTGKYLIYKDEALPAEAITEPPVPAGMFRVVYSNELGIGIAPYTPDFDDYVDLHSHTSAIQNDIDVFLQKEDQYRKLGLLYRRGLLLYGPPGTGKSVLIEHLCAKYREQVRVLVVPTGFSVSMLNDLRGLLKDRVTIFIFEEITSMTGRQDEVASLLNFLDGQNSWDKSIVIATTNYPQALPGNIVDRPSRFDRLYKVDCPTEEVRRIYLEAKLGKDAVSDELVKATKGYSIAHLRELVVSIPIYGQDPQTRLAEIEEVKRRVQKEFAENPDRAIGFSSE